MSLLTNKKAYFDYEILSKYEAGIELLGNEVKSIRLGRGELVGSHVIIRGGEAFLINFEIPPYQAKNTSEDYEPSRTRRLILKKKEIAELARAIDEKGLTVVPISLYNKGRKLKMEIGIGKGKKKFDKRESIKKRETDREIRRTLK